MHTRRCVKCLTEFKTRLIHPAQRCWKCRNRHKDRARNIMNRAILSGQLMRRPCIICGDLKSEGHHDDYDMPFNIVWLCPKHHYKYHAIQRKLTQVISDQARLNDLSIRLAAVKPREAPM